MTRNRFTRQTTTRLQHLEKKASPRTKPVQIAPPDRPEAVDEPRRRALLLAQLRAQLLFGIPRSEGPAPSLGVSELCASLLRASALETPEWGELAVAIRRSPSTEGPAHFGSAWPEVSWIFGAREFPRSTAPLESVDLAEWERAEWQRYLESPEYARDVEAGVFVASTAGNHADHAPDTTDATAPTTAPVPSSGT